MLEAAVFNLNDLAVAFTGLLALIIALLLMARSRNDKLRNLLLAAFFLQSTLFSIDTLLYWNVNINALVSSISANFFFTLGFTFFLQGPLLYWITRLVIYRNFRIEGAGFLHLLPAIAYPFFLYAIYYRFDETHKLQFVHDWSMVYDNPYFTGLIWVQILAFFTYSVFCLQNLRYYQAHLKRTGTGAEKIDIHWLKVLIFGFVLINSWHLLILLLSHTFLWFLGYAMGTMKNYFRLVMMGGLMAYLMRHSIGFPAIGVEYAIGNPLPLDVQELHLQKLRALMEAEKPYLQPNINVERLASRLEISPKLLSAVINKKLNQNFFEMIRNYRIEEVKMRLCNEAYRLQSINEIMQDCGFNSKSVFNQCFKEQFGVTPSHFRKQHLG
jgi:AraC-like DNA-binding protein